MPDSLILLLIVVPTIPLALLAAYVHARCYGWTPDQEEN